MKVSKRDNDGHKYKIPLELSERFDSLMESINYYDMGSKDWYDYNDLLDYEFGQYMESE